MTGTSPGRRGVGVFDDFPGFRVPSEEELRAALRSALVVLDTNVLLNLYRYGDGTRRDMLDVLAGMGERLWVPHQVMREFWRNRLAVIDGRNSGAEQAVTALGAVGTATVDTIERWARTALVGPAEQERLIERIDRMHAELAEALRTHAPAPIDISGGAADDLVLRVLETLLEGKVGPAAAPDAWCAAVAEGVARIARREPPGYLDADKAGSGLPEGATGDYLVWRQAVEEAAARSADPLIVTGDQKADWWWRYGDDLIGPRPELVAEFASVAGGRLFLMRPADLLRRGSALAVPVRGESVADVERVSAGAGPAWTASGVAALLELLDGTQQAAVIRAAGARGGRLNRAEIAEVCGIDDENGLPAFTVPVDRATRELQAAGLVAPGVEPALVAEPGTFRVPDEIAARLAGPA